MAILIPAIWPPAALAGAADFDRAQKTEVWRGCVDQPGHEPYPVTLIRRAEGGFKVRYESLACSGYHVAHADHEADAIERIETGTDVCVPIVPVTYEMRSDRQLDLVFWWDDGIHDRAFMARARLLPASLDRAPRCGRKEGSV